MRKSFTRREYELAAIAAVRRRRQIVLYWARRCHKSTTLGSIGFDEMASEAGRTVIAASASLLLGKELVGMTLSASEQAAIVTSEAAAVRTVFETGSADKGLDLKVAKIDTGKIVTGLSAEDFAALYKSSNMEMRLYFDRTSYSRLKVIAPNPATARGWGGTVLRDEAGFTPPNLENDLRVATKPIMDTDPTFKLVYASNLCRNDRHPFFEMTMPPPDLEFPANPQGHFYLGQHGILIHRVALADAYAAGHQLYDDRGKPLTYEEFKAQPGNAIGFDESYGLDHKSGGTAAIDLVALLMAQRRGAGECAFVFADSDAAYRRALDLLSGLLGSGRVGIGFDVASTTGESSNPSSITVTESSGGERFQRLVLVFKSKKRVVMSERLAGIVRVVRARPEGGPARRLCIDASNERLAAEETRDDLSGQIPVELVINSVSAPQPAGTEPINFKTFLGDLYSDAVNSGRTAVPADEYIKIDHRLTIKDQGRYLCIPDNEGRHGDTFDSGKLAEWALVSSHGAITSVEGIRLGGQTAHHYHPPRLKMTEVAA